MAFRRVVTEVPAWKRALQRWVYDRSYFPSLVSLGSAMIPRSQSQRPVFGSGLASLPAGLGDSHNSNLQITLESFTALHKNPVSALMEYAQSRQMQAIIEVVKQHGPPHRLMFVIAAKVGTRYFPGVLCYEMNDGRKKAADLALRTLIAEGQYSVSALSPSVTYLRLFAQLCEDGNIPGATLVLEHMKASSLPIGDQFFNSYITWHLRAKDPESAKNILDAMRQAGLEPTNDTYLALGVGFAEMGQIEEVKKPVEKVAVSVQEMQEKQINKDDLGAVAQQAYLENKPLNAVSLLEKMRSQSLPVHARYFRPVFGQLREEKNRDAIYETAGKMVTLTDTRDDFVQTLQRYIVPALLEVGETLQDIVSKLETRGYEEKEVNFAYFMYLLDTDDAKAAADFLEGHDVKIVFGALLTTFPSLVSRTDDYQLIFKILAKLRAQCSLWQRLACKLTSAALERALTIESQSNWSSGQQVFDFMVEKKLMISQRHVKKLSACMAGAPTELIERLKDVVSEDTAFATEGETPETDLTLQELKKMSDTNPSNKALRKRLLIKACAVGDIQEAEKVVAQLEVEGSVCRPILLTQLAYLYAMFAKDISKARSYMDQLQSKFPKHGHYMTAVLKLAALQAGHGKVDDAVKTLEMYADKHKDMIQRWDFQRKNYIADVIKAAQDVESAKRLLDCVVNSGYLHAENGQLFDAYIEKVIESRDPDRILQETEHIIKTQHCSRSIDSVFKFFIEKEDPERLQKVVDLLAELHGLMNVYHNLIANFIECGHIKRARKILKTPGFRANMQRLNYYCQSFIERNKIKELEMLVQVTRDLFGVDRDNMLFHLIRGYVRQNNLQLAQDVLLRYEEDMLQPSVRTLHFLACSLEREGKPVPFDVPEFEPPASLPKARQAKRAKPETKQETTQKRKTWQSQAPKTTANRQMKPLLLQTCPLLLRRIMKA